MPRLPSHGCWCGFMFLKCVCVCVLQVEKELKSICNDILDVLDKHLIGAATTGESKVFYYKMYVSSVS